MGDRTVIPRMAVRDLVAAPAFLRTVFATSLDEPADTPHRDRCAVVGDVLARRCG
jgi:hypothetical protein